METHNSIEVTCPFCGSTEKLNGLLAWSFIILGYKNCDNCGNIITK